MRVFILQEPPLLSYFNVLMLNYHTRHSPSDIHKLFLPSIITDFGSRSRRETNTYMLRKYNVFPKVKVVKTTRYCNCHIWNGSV